MTTLRPIPIFSQHQFATVPGITPMPFVGPQHPNGFTVGFSPDVPPEQFADLVCGPNGENIGRVVRQLSAAPPGLRALYVGGWMFVQRHGHSDALFRQYCEATYLIWQRHAAAFEAADVWPDFNISDGEPDEQDGGLTETARLVRQFLYEKVGTVPALFRPRQTVFISWQIYDGHGRQADEYTKPDNPFSVKRKFLLPSGHACVHGYLLPEGGPFGGHVDLDTQVDQIINQAVGAYMDDHDWVVLVGGFTQYHGSVYAVEGDGGETDAKYQAAYTRMARTLRDKPGFRGVWGFFTAGHGQPAITDPAITYPPPPANQPIPANLNKQIEDEAAIVNAWCGEDAAEPTDENSAATVAAIRGNS